MSSPADTTPLHTIVSPESPLSLPVPTQPIAFTSTLFTPPVLTPTAAKRTKRSHDPDEVDRIIDYLKTKNRSKFDAVDHLFQSYADTFKQFSERNKIMIKVELAKLFADTELKEIEERFLSRNSTTYSVISSDYENTMYPMSPEYHIPSAQEARQSPTSPGSSIDTNLDV